jgi:hypothetical protein
MSADHDILLGRIGRSSRRLRVFAVITAALCLGLAALAFADPSLRSSGVAWQVGLIVFEVFMIGVAILMLYGAFWRVGARGRRLQRILRDDPGSITAVSAKIARGVPVAHWDPDDGSTRIGLHLFVEDASGSSWVLPATRDELDAMMAALADRCPNARFD